ncbi:hypothetical protein ABIB15_002390 [Marisediminicola sp. UYEF4]|uniref:hypothetical protein n=1 Tax=Marisediminicola sp. UYEF4 TaxID=1756384 RepID=UPI0033954F2E
MTMTTKLGRATRRIGAVALVAVLVGTLLGLTERPAPVSAAVGGDFNAGNIISDATFYDSNTMSVAEIQSFLTAKRPSCASGFTCLKDYKDSFSSRAADSRCGALQGQNLMSAAAIIYWVGKACGINPQVMIVLLEKEQGLVTASSPTSTRYKIATGYGCPDTAPCDSLYYGFFNQVYNAARQFKSYQSYATSFRYRAGQWNTIQWHPNAGCGSSSVYLENQATAGLYNYTPYRPNGAALANMYGTGDSCSSYGNRNFWRIFSDWFGSTQGGSDFVRTTADPRLFLLTGATKHHVPTALVHTALAPLGGYRIVSPEYLKGFAEGKPASEVVRDPATGTVSLAQGGALHRFPSCELVALYGYACTDAINLAPTQFAKFPEGAETTKYFQVVPAATVFSAEAGEKVSFRTIEALDAFAGGRPAYIASMRAEVAALYPDGRSYAAPMSLLKSPDRPEVYLVDGWDRKIPIASFASASDVGSNGYRVEPSAVVDAYPTAPTGLASVVRCDGQLFMAGSGRLSQVTSGDAAGLPVTDLSSISCASAAKSATTIDGAIFVKATNNAVVHIAKAGKLHPVGNFASLVALNGGKVPAIAAVSPEPLAMLPKGETVLNPGTLVRTQTNGSIFLIDGLDRKIPIAAFATPAEFGVTGWGYASETMLAQYATAPAPLGMMVNCGGVAYFGASGALHPVAPTAGTGLTGTELKPGTCGLLRRSTAAPLEQLLVKTATSPTVHYIQNGQRRLVSSWDSLLAITGGVSPRILQVSGATIAALPEGPRS